MNKEMNMNSKLAIIRIKGVVRISKEVATTLINLRLYKKNHCVVIENNPSNNGMLKKAKDSITWGEIDEDTLALLKEKREQKARDRDGKEVIKPYFRLSPPRGGFERKGTKKPFSIGGVLGYRGAKINDLIKRML